LPRVTALLARYRPDLACLQEIKTSTEEFPAADFAAAGYQAAVYGQAGRNGVAVLSLTTLTDVARGFADDPVPEQARVLSVTAGGMRVVNVYVVNGRQVGAPEYELKLRWLDDFTTWLRSPIRPRAPCWSSAISTSLLTTGTSMTRSPGAGGTCAASRNGAASAPCLAGD
jgi:exodeoxyribonuclease III